MKKLPKVVLYVLFIACVMGGLIALVWLWRRM